MNDLVFGPTELQAGLIALFYRNLWAMADLYECLKRYEDREEKGKMMEQAISNCFLTHRYVNPGMEEGMCAGLRTMNGEGEPLEKCKECRLCYAYTSEHKL